METIKNIRYKNSLGEEITVPLGALAENIVESQERMFVTATEKNKLNARPIEITLRATSWIYASGIYAQTIYNSEIQAAYETYYSVYNSYSENASKTLGTDSNDADSFLQSTQSGSNITEQLDEAYSTLYSLIDDEVNNVLLLH